MHRYQRPFNAKILLTVLSAITFTISPAFETDKYCASGSKHPAVDGVYHFNDGYFDGRSETTGPVFINQRRYQDFEWVVNLYASPSTNSYTYWIGSSAYASSAYNTNSYLYPYTFDPNHFFTNWKYYEGEWRSDSDLRMVNCNSLYINGNSHYEFNGIYDWQSFDRILSGSIYFCETCAYGAGTYLKPYRNRDGIYQWIITDTLSSFQSECTITHDLDLLFASDVTDCTIWTSSNGADIINESDIVIQRSDLTPSTTELTQSTSDSPIKDTLYPPRIPTESLPNPTKQSSLNTPLFNVTSYINTTSITSMDNNHNIPSDLHTTPNESVKSMNTMNVTPSDTTTLSKSTTDTSIAPVTMDNIPSNRKQSDKTLHILYIILILIICVISAHIIIITMIYIKDWIMKHYRAGSMSNMDRIQHVVKEYEDDDDDVIATVNGIISTMRGSNNKYTKKTDVSLQSATQQVVDDLKVTLDAMKNDKIALRVISTERRGDSMNETDGIQTTLNAMKNDKIALGIITTKD